MPVRNIQSKDNACLKELRKALNAPGRGAGKLAGGGLAGSAGGMVGIEGPNLVEEAIRAGLRIKTVFVAQGAERLLEKLRLPPDTEILLVPKKLLDSILATETPQSIAALVKPPEWTWAHVLGARPHGSVFVLVLAGIQDPGNLGTIVRSAEAFGASGIVTLPGTVSAWNPKAVRASAGSVFRVPAMVASEQVCFGRLREAGVKILAASARAAQPSDLVDWSGPLALVIGNEGKGISVELMAKVDEQISIPCPGPVESLNAGVAASVLLYEAARQRATAAGNPRAASKTPARGSAEKRGARR
jgi:TrmH family RNA methyltransferase